MANRRDLVQAIQDGDEGLVRDIVTQDGGVARGATEAGVPLVLFAAYHNNDAITDIVARHAGPLDLWSAVALGQVDAVREILANDPQAVTKIGPDGFAPLHLAAHFGHGTLLKLLIDNGAETTQVSENPFQATALHSAVAAGRLGAGRFLLEKQADPNARQAAGVTALHLAAHAGDFELVQLLLHFGADPGAKTEEGRTPLQMAEEGRHSDVIEALHQGRPARPPGGRA